MDTINSPFLGRKFQRAVSRAAERLRLAVSAAEAGIVAASDTLILWQERSRQRRLLASLDIRMLRDIGLSPADALYEAGKPFWRP